MSNSNVISIPFDEATIFFEQTDDSIINDVVKLPDEIQNVSIITTSVNESINQDQNIKRKTRSNSHQKPDENFIVSRTPVKKFTFKKEPDSASVVQYNIAKFSPLRTRSNKNVSNNDLSFKTKKNQSQTLLTKEKSANKVLDKKNLKKNMNVIKESKLQRNKKALNTYQSSILKHKNLDIKTNKANTSDSISCDGDKKNKKDPNKRSLKKEKSIIRTSSFDKSGIIPFKNLPNEKKVLDINKKSSSKEKNLNMKNRQNNTKNILIDSNQKNLSKKKKLKAKEEIIDATPKIKKNIIVKNLKDDLEKENDECPINKFNDTFGKDELLNLYSQDGINIQKKKLEKKKQVDLKNPMYQEPFKHGWIREVVYRTKNSLTNSADIYYYTPKSSNAKQSREKLRSMNQLRSYLKNHPSQLSIECFTLFKGPISDDPKKEIVRGAYDHSLNVTKPCSSKVFGKIPKKSDRLKRQKISSNSKTQETNHWCPQYNEDWELTHFEFTTLHQNSLKQGDEFPCLNCSYLVAKEGLNVSVSNTLLHSLRDNYNDSQAPSFLQTKNEDDIKSFNKKNDLSSIAEVETNELEKYCSVDGEIDVEPKNKTFDISGHIDSIQNLESQSLQIEISETSKVANESLAENMNICQEIIFNQNDVEMTLDVKSSDSNYSPSKMSDPVENIVQVIKVPNMETDVEMTLDAKSSKVANESLAENMNICQEIIFNQNNVEMTLDVKSSNSKYSPSKMSDPVENIVQVIKVPNMETDVEMTLDAKSSDSHHSPLKVSSPGESVVKVITKQNVESDLALTLSETSNPVIQNSMKNEKKCCIDQGWLVNLDEKIPQEIIQSNRDDSTDTNKEEISLTELETLPIQYENISDYESNENNDRNNFINKNHLDSAKNISDKTFEQNYNIGFTCDKNVEKIKNNYDAKGKEFYHNSSKTEVQYKNLLTSEVTKQSFMIEYNSDSDTGKIPKEIFQPNVQNSTQCEKNFEVKKFNNILGVCQQSEISPVHSTNKHDFLQYLEIQSPEVATYNQSYNMHKKNPDTCNETRESTNYPLVAENETFNKKEESSTLQPNDVSKKVEANDIVDGRLPWKFTEEPKTVSNFPENQCFSDNSIRNPLSFPDDFLDEKNSSDLSSSLTTKINLNDVADKDLYTDESKIKLDSDREVASSYKIDTVNCNKNFSHTNKQELGDSYTINETFDPRFESGDHIILPKQYFRKHDSKFENHVDSQTYYSFSSTVSVSTESQSSITDSAIECIAESDQEKLSDELVLRLQSSTKVDCFHSGHDILPMLNNKKRKTVSDNELLQPQIEIDENISQNYGTVISQFLNDSVRHKNRNLNLLSEVIGLKNNNSLQKLNEEEPFNIHIKNTPISTQELMALNANQSRSNFPDALYYQELESSYVPCSFGLHNSRENFMTAGGSENKFEELNDSKTDLQNCSGIQSSSSNKVIVEYENKINATKQSNSIKSRCLVKKRKFDATQNHTRNSSNLVSIDSNLLFSPIQNYNTVTESVSDNTELLIKSFDDTRCVTDVYPNDNFTEDYSRSETLKISNDSKNDVVVSTPTNKEIKFENPTIPENADEIEQFVNIIHKLTDKQVTLADEGTSIKLIKQNSFTCTPGELLAVDEILETSVVKDDCSVKSCPRLDNNMITGTMDIEKTVDSKNVNYFLSEKDNLTVTEEINFNNNESSEKSVINAETIETSNSLKRPNSDDSFLKQKKIKISPSIPCQYSHNMVSFNASFACLQNIFEYLNVEELLIARKVCKAWRDITTLPSFWEKVKIYNDQLTLEVLKALQYFGTKYLFVDERNPNSWDSCLELIPKLDGLHKLDLSNCPTYVVESITKNFPTLQILLATSIKSNHLNLEDFDHLKYPDSIGIKSINGMAIKGDLSSFSGFNDLTYLSLTSIINLSTANLPALGYLKNLKALELGNCTDISDSFSFLSKLINLKRLRLEKVDGFTSNADFLIPVSNLENLTQLELVNINVSDEFEEFLPLCKNIEQLLIVPIAINQHISLSNTIILKSTSKLFETLKRFVYAIDTQYLKVPTELNAWASNCSPVTRSILKYYEFMDQEDFRDTFKIHHTDLYVNILRFYEIVAPEMELEFYQISSEKTWKLFLIQNE